MVDYSLNMVDRAVFARVHLANFADYAAMNRVYAGYFTPGRLPARTCVGVTGLALGPSSRST